jgi:hypothetical protein
MITRALVVKEPWATLIVEGKKQVEYRSRYTRIRERIGIIQAGTKTILGEVNLVDCQWASDPIDPHYCEYRWILMNPQKYIKPRPYKHPCGAQIWIRLDTNQSLGSNSDSTESKVRNH